MGRKSHSRSLAVWINGQRVATWRMPARGAVELQYDDQWVNAPQGRPLSLSLPFQPGKMPIRGDVVAHYFDNLLPDSEPIRRRLAQRYRSETTGAFDMLQQLGRDCVGAVQLLNESEQPGGYDRIEGEVLSEVQVERHLQRVVTLPGAMGRQGDTEDDLRLSIAGAQEKTALLWHQDQWVLPRGATPTTHIFKLPLGRVGNEGRLNMNTSVENEWLCLRILDAFGLRVPRAAILRFGGQKVLGVERFDRRLHADGGWWMRLPQEDFCQARGLPSSLKYESDGGPGIQSICDILQGSVAAEQDVRDFLSSQILFWMLAATDGHAKNFSIQLLKEGQYRLTPLYDVISMWPVIGHGAGKLEWQKARLAMSVRGNSRHYRLHEIQRRHFNAMAARCGLGADAEDLIQALIQRTPSVIDKVSRELPEGFPDEVADLILDNLQNSAQRLSDMPPR
jgi:serine/threonine-protein kinase HipA